jgi:pimeloyl-ACP methyl ester carboxylesterase
MYGERTSPMLKAGTIAVAESVEGAELVVIPGEDHGVLQRPKAIAPTIVEFLRGLAEQGE